MKQRHWGLGLLLICVLLWRQGEIHFLNTVSLPPPRPVIHTSSYRSITGIILEGPQKNTKSEWLRIMSFNHDYLKIRLYDITDPQLIKWLSQQANLSTITLILENQKYQQFGNDYLKTLQKINNDSLTLLKDENLDVSYTHAKTFVGETRRAIQTANLNTTSFTTNREHFFFSQDEKIRKDLLALFSLDEEKIKNPHHISSSDYESRVLSVSPELIVCPLNCRTIIENALKTAQKRIRISAQYISDPSIISILQQQKSLDLRIITNTLDSNRNLIRDIGSDRILFEQQLYNHDKLLIVDDVLILGSMNLSANSLDHNREIGIIITDSLLIQQVEGLFDHQKFIKKL